jgi:DNA-binding SARP family transcriptional activator
MSRTRREAGHGGAVGPPRVRVQLCGEFLVEVDGRRVDPAFPGRQGRLLFAFLLLHGPAPVSRDALISVLWPDRVPDDAPAALSSHLSRVRRALWPEAISGRSTVSLVLPPAAWVDLREAEAANERAEAALRESRWGDALRDAQEAASTTGRGCLPGLEGPWVEERRQAVAELRLTALETVAEAGLQLGGGGNAAAEAASRTLIEEAPFRESGYRLLMEMHAARGNVAEALQVYDLLRTFLVDELGAAPGRQARDLHARLLDEHSGGALAGPDSEARVLAEQHRVELPRPVAGDHPSAFVGRESELGSLEEALDDVRAGKRRIVLLAGEPGIGKTRLAVEFALRAHEQGASVLYGRAFEETIVSYEPFVAALRHYVVASPVEALRAQLGRGGGELARLVPDLRERVPDLPEPIHGDPAGERYRAFEAVAELLRRASEERPLILILDDLHAGDAGTLLLLRHIAHFPHPSKLLVLGTYRDTELAPDHPLSEALVELRRDALLAVVSVAGLTEHEIDALIDARAGAHVPADLARAISARTAGNPFFVSELVNHLLESGRLDEPDADLGGIGVPEGVKDVISQRVVRLGGELARALSMAAVLGREFDVDLLEQATGLHGDELAEGLERAARAGLVTESQEAVGWYGFSHSLVREALYESLSAVRRARLHRRAGEAIERLGSSQRESRLAELAHHFLEAASAGNGRGKALDYARRAGDRAMENLAYEEAARHYERALAVVDTTVAEGEALRCDLLLSLGHAHSRVAERAEARAAFQSAAALAKEIGAPELLARAALAFPPGYPEIGIADDAHFAVLEDALAALPDEDGPLRAATLAKLGQALYFSDARERGRELTDLGLAMARRVADRPTLALALASTTYWGPDELDARTEVARELVAVAEEVGDKELVLQGRHWNSTNAFEVGDAEAAERERVEVDRLAKELRQPFLMRFTARWRVWRALLEGRFHEVERLAHHALAVAQRAQTGDAAQIFGAHSVLLRREQGRVHELVPGIEHFAESFPAISGWRCGLAAILAELGETSRAAAELDRMGRVEDIPRDMFWLISLWYLSEACATLGEAERASAIYELLLPFAHRVVIMGDGACLGPVTRSLGQLATTLGRWDEADQHLTRALEVADRLGSPPMAAHIRADRARLLAARDGPGDRDAAAREMEQAAAVAERLGMVALRERLRALDALPR